MLLRRIGNFWPKGSSSQKVGHSTRRHNGVETTCITNCLCPLLAPLPKSVGVLWRNREGSNWSALTLSLSLSNSLIKWPWKVKFCFSFHTVKVYLGLSQSPMAPLKASREEKLLQVAIHLLERKTEQLTSGGTCFALQSSGDTSCGLEMKGWISAVAPFFGT